jgi:hypothetical protein
MKRFLPTVSCALVMLLGRQLFAQEKSYGPEAPASASEVEALKQEVKRQAEAHEAELARHRDQIKKLERALDEERTRREEDRAEESRDAESIRAAIDRSTVVRSRRLGVSIMGFLQADWFAWRQSSQDEVNPSTGQPLNDQRFLVRRARLRAQVDYSVIQGAIEFDGNTVNGYQARIIGAEASLLWRNPSMQLTPYLGLTIGSFKIPFGFEIGQSDRERLFMERSNFERAVFPGEYDLGIRLAGGWRFLRYSVAAMNGDPIGEKLFPGRDPNQSKDLVGRLGLEMRVLRRLGIQAGVSAVYGEGFHKGVAASKDTLVWRDTDEDGVVQINEINVIPGQTPMPSQNFSRWAVGGDLLLTFAIPKLGELTLYGELAYAVDLDRALLVADPVAAGRDLRELGWYVAATQELTRWAMVGARYDHYDPDRDSHDLGAGAQVPSDLSFSTLSVAAAVRYPGYGRLSMEYQHNTNPYGRTMAGLPTSIADDSFILRGQVEF